MDNHDYDNGFMLLDALVAMSAIAIGLMGLAWTLQLSFKHLKRIEDHTKILIQAHNTCETTPVSSGTQRIRIPISRTQSLECLR